MSMCRCIVFMIGEVLECRGNSPSDFEECFLLRDYFFFFLGLKLSFMAAIPVRTAPIPRRMSPRRSSIFHLLSLCFYFTQKITLIKK